MQLRTRMGGWALGLLAVVVAAPLRAQDDFAALVPSTSLAVVRISKPADFEKECRTLIEKVSPGDPDTSLINLILSNTFGVDTGMIDLDQPVALCVLPTPDGDDVPGVALICCPKNPEAFQVALDDNEAEEVKTRGRFMLGRKGGNPSESEQPWAHLGSMPPGDFVVRMDMKRITDNYRGFIDMILEEIEREMAQEMRREIGSEAAGKMTASMVGMVREVMDSARTLDLIGNIDNSMIAFDGALTIGEGTALSRRSLMGSRALKSLAPFLPKHHPLTMGAAFDVATILEFQSEMMEPMAAKLPQEFQDAYRRVMARSAEFVAAIEPESAASLGVGPAGLEMASVVRCKDPQKALGIVTALLRDPMLTDMGVMVEEGAATGEASEHTFTVKFDREKLRKMGGEFPPEDEMRSIMQALLGEDDLVFRASISGKHLLYSLGGKGTLLPQMLAGEGGGPGFTTSLDRAGTAPLMAGFGDVREILRQLGTMAGRFGERLPFPESVLQGPPIPVHLYGGRTGLTFTAGMMLDVVQLAELGKTIRW